jgi:hypothetical protein
MAGQGLDKDSVYCNRAKSDNQFEVEGYASLLVNANCHRDVVLEKFPGVLRCGAALQTFVRGIARPLMRIPMAASFKP